MQRKTALSYRASQAGLLCMTAPVGVLIIGAGASAAAVAWSLAETKMHILCLEQGDWMKPSEYASTARDWEARQFNDFHISPNRRKRDTDYPINYAARRSRLPISILERGPLGTWEEDYPPSTAVHRRVTDPTLSGTFVDTTGCTKDGSKPTRGQRMPGAGLN
jgi:choline dehydrogenase-like flavoprotein